jgi:cysteine-rich repeat protein
MTEFKPTSVVFGPTDIAKDDLTAGAWFELNLTVPLGFSNTTNIILEFSTDGQYYTSSISGIYLSGDSFGRSWAGESDSGHDSYPFGLLRGEAIDDGNGLGAGVAAIRMSVSPCSNPCGDAQIKCLETCDDGNTADGDGCSSDCQTEPGFA